MVINITIEELLFRDIIFKQRLERLSYLIASSCLFLNEHPITTLQNTFGVPFLITNYLFDDTDMEDDKFLYQLSAKDYGITEDPELKDTIWSLLVYILEMTYQYNYQIEDIYELFNQHYGWEFLASSGRHICYENAYGGAKIINNFIISH